MSWKAPTHLSEHIPKYLLYSEQDLVVPFHHGKQIFEELEEPKFFWSHSERGHINAFAIQNGKRRAELVRELERALKNKDYVTRM